MTNHLLKLGLNMRFLFLISFCLYSLNASELQVKTLEKHKNTTQQKEVKPINKYYGFDKCGSLTLDIKCNYNKY